MGKELVHFRCVHCGHCCRDVVCLPTPWDVVQLARETGEDPHRFLQFVTHDDIEEVANSDPTWLSVKGRRYMMALRRDPKKGCWFLDRKTLHCRAYASRPLLCRLYPFALHETRKGKFKSFDLHKNVGCPRNREGDVATKPLYDLYRQDFIHQRDYNDLVEVFNRRDPQRPAEFIDLFYKRA
jgi:Fe-S-cluster containining protein